MSTLFIRICKLLQRGDGSHGGALLVQVGHTAVALISKLPDVLSVVHSELQTNSCRQVVQEKKGE